MAAKFVKGEKQSAEQVARELIPIMAMWGLSQETAKDAAWYLFQSIQAMTEDDYAKAAKGLRIKSGLPNNNAPPQTQN